MKAGDVISEAAWNTWTQGSIETKREKELPDASKDTQGREML